MIRLAFLPLLAGVALPALAQAPASKPAPPRPVAAANDDEEIVVQGQKPPGSVIGDIPPEQVLTPADVRAYGVNSIADLINELSPQTQSNRGRGGEAPAVLLNGRRISGFSEIRDVPTEAILRVEILPEEVALKYGFSADQKVVNIVLRRRFRAKTAVADGSTSTEGGGESGTIEGGLTRIQGDNRLNLNLRAQSSARLLESQRDLISTAAGTPFDLVGNVVAPNGGQIDPRLSALVGQTVTIAGVPTSAATTAPTLGSFAGTANRANATDVSPYRTLRPATDTLTFNSVYSRAFGSVSATVNGMLTATQNKSLNGLPSAALGLLAGNPYSPFASGVQVDRFVDDDPLGQRVKSLTGHLGVGLNGQVDQWRWTVTGNYDHGDSRTSTQRGYDLSALQARLAANDPTANPYGPLGSLIGAMQVDRARARSDSGDLQAILNGKLATLPAGNLSTTIKVGGTFQSLDARSTRAGVTQDSDLSRQGANGQINVDLPIASRRTGTLAALGNLTANANLALNHLSDFGTLTTYGYGLNWTPRPPLSLIASVTHDRGAPSVPQLGNPVVINPQARVFDYARGQTVDVTAVTGGNPDLLADNRRVFKAGATWKPLPKADLSLVANYVSSRIRNIIASLPEPTAGVEAAFPTRFTRDADGDLIRIDTRAVNFARQDQESLRMGFNLSIPLKPSQATIDAFRKMAQARGFGLPGAPGAGGNPPPGDAPPPPPPGEGGGARPDGPPGGGGFGGPPGGRGPGGGGFGGRGPGGRNGGGRVQVALYHTWYFQDEVLIRPGLPVLDRLNGDATGSGGGQPRHEVEAQLGYANNGLGVRLSGNWQSATFVRGSAASTVGDLRFSDLTTVDLRVFGDMGFMPAFIGKDWARNLRVTFAVTNIFNERQRVRDALGDTPVRYQPGYLDPLGRSVRIGIRKLFAPIPARPVTPRATG